jgi:hypothetical protein
MARANFKLINAIKKAAHKIENGTDYQWGHMGGCNCGHLAQELTTFTKREIHEYAMRKSGDWTDQVQDYCSSSQMPMDEIISTMMESGLERRDMIELERLNNHEVRLFMGEVGKSLSHNSKRDVVKYMKAWAEMLEIGLVENIQLPDHLFSQSKIKEKEIA